MKCAGKDCPNEATAGVSLRVPFKKRIFFTSPEPTRLLLGLELCPGCMEKTKPSDFLSAKKPGMIEQVLFLQSRHIGKLAYKRAYIEPVEFTDPAWILLKRQK